MTKNSYKTGPDELGYYGEGDAAMGGMAVGETLMPVLHELSQGFEDAIKDRQSKKLSSETTFIGISSAEVKQHEQNKNMLEVTVEFVSEIISCVKDKDNKVISGDPEKIKKVLDTWKFSKDSRSANPNWLLIDTQA